jgi:hypothetical protein
MLLSLIWLAWASLPWIVLHSVLFTSESPDDVARVKSVLGQLGTFGDMFGALTCLFSGAAFLGAGYAVVLQLRALRHQQDEMDKADRRHAAADRERERDLKDAAQWQRRMALLQTTSYLIHAQASRMNSLQAIELDTLSQDGRKAALSEVVALSSDLVNNINILSRFVSAMAVEHAEDVIDPQDFRRMFGIEPITSE